MKKIVSLVVFFFAFSLNIQAQTEAEKEVTIQAKAKQDISDLSNVIDLSQNSSLSNSFLQLFLYKHKNLSNSGITEEDRKNLSRIIQEKIIATLSSEELSKITNTPGLLQKLTN